MHRTSIPDRRHAGPQPPRRPVTEIAAALTMVGKKVTIIFPGDAIGGNIFPSDLAHFLNEYYREKGVEVLTGDSVASVQKDGDRHTVRTGSGRAIEADGVVAGIGIGEFQVGRPSRLDAG